MPERETLVPRKSITRAPGRVRIPAGLGTDPPAGADPGPGASGPQGRVEAVRGPDGAVRQIIVRCACGAETVIQCQYAPTAARPAPARARQQGALP